MATKKRLIDANVVLDRLKGNFILSETEKAFLRNYVNSCPTVDAAEVVHGRWVMGFSVRCSVCNGYALTDEDNDPWITPYCPNCGAKMDGGSHETD